MSTARQPFFDCPANVRTLLVREVRLVVLFTFRPVTMCPTVAPVFFLRAPSQIARSAVAVVTVEVANLSVREWRWTVERRADKSVNAACGFPTLLHYGNTWLGIFLPPHPKWPPTASCFGIDNSI